MFDYIKLYFLIFLALGLTPVIVARSGALDKDFGDNGLVTTTIPTVPAGNHVIINGLTMDDNRIVAVGRMIALYPRLTPTGIIARYNSAGNPDKTFNALGYVTRPQVFFNATTMTTLYRDIPCSGILTAGRRSFFDSTGLYARGQFHVSAMEVTSNCHLGFRNDAQLEFENTFGSEARALALDSRANIVLGGFVIPSNNKVRHFGLARTTPYGFSDPSFGINGFVETSISDVPNNLEQINGIAITPDDRIIVVGQALLNGEQRFVVARYTSEGKPDTSFGVSAHAQDPIKLHNGALFVDFAAGTHTAFKNDSARAVVIQPDGKIVVAGYAHNDKGTFSVVIVRFMYDGNIDRDFGNNGIVVSDFSSVSARAYALALQKNGSLVIAGSTIDTFADDTKHAGQQFIVARYLPNGTPDRSFGDRGKSCAAFDNNGAEAYAVTLDHDERIILGGYAIADNGIARFALARFLS